LFLSRMKIAFKGELLNVIYFPSDLYLTFIAENGIIQSYEL
jgi:hypothetical protein